MPTHEKLKRKFLIFVWRSIFGCWFFVLFRLYISLRRWNLTSIIYSFRLKAQDDVGRWLQNVGWICCGNKLTSITTMIKNNARCVSLHCWSALPGARCQIISKLCDGMSCSSVLIVPYPPTMSIISRAKRFVVSAEPFRELNGKDLCFEWNATNKSYYVLVIAYSVEGFGGSVVTMAIESGYAQRSQQRSFNMYH